MVEVHLWASLRRFADGQESVEIEGKTVGEVLKNLAAAHPGLAPAIEAGAGLTVDGTFLGSGRNHVLDPEAEVFLMMRIKGG
jgi:molybdopterin converting factor small subunit